MGSVLLFFVPGLLITNNFKIKYNAFLKSLVLSLGLSISIVYVIGLILNLLFVDSFDVKKILAVYNVMIVLLILMLIYNLGSLQRCIKLGTVHGIKKQHLLPIIIFMISLTGINIMNNTNNNTFLLVALLLMPVLVFILAYSHGNNEERDNYFQFSILLIALSLCMIYGLRSNYIAPADGSGELYVFRLTLHKLNWDISDYYNNLSSCLSVTIMPTIIKQLIDINNILVYKIVYNIILAVIPLVCYYIFKNFMKYEYAFMSCFFFVSQHTYLSMLGWIIFRQIIALYFIALLFMVYFDDDLNPLVKKIFIIVFMVSIVLSHYATAYLLFFILAMYLLVSILVKRQEVLGDYNNINITLILLFGVMIFCWYSQITEVPFNSITLFFKKNINNLLEMTLDGIKYEEHIVVNREMTIADIISYVVYYISFGFILLGGYYITISRKNLHYDWVVFVVISIFVLIVLTFLSFFIVGYGASRVYQQLLILLSPAVIYGMIMTFKKRKIINLVLIIALSAQFFSSTYIIYQLFNQDHSEFFNSTGNRFESYYVAEMDYKGADWLYNKNKHKRIVNADYPGRYVYGQFNMKDIEMLSNNSKSGYIFLRTVNVRHGRFYTKFGEYVKMDKYINIFKNDNNVYSNGGSNIYQHNNI
jgi:uncharacterized membrane protein